MPTLRAVLGSSFNTTTGTHTVTATPQVGDLIIIVIANTGIAAGDAVTDNNADGLGTYAIGLTRALKNTSADTVSIRVRNALVGSATSTIFSGTGASSTGGGIVVLAISGMVLAGAAALRSQGKQENQAAGGTPAPVLSNTPVSINLIIEAVFNASNPAAITPRTGYSEAFDNGYNTPTTGLEVATRNSGETSATLTVGSTSATAFASTAIELDGPISGTLAKTLDALTSVGAGTVRVAGTLAQTLAALTVDAEGKAYIFGVLDKALGALALLSEGDVLVAGTLAKTLEDLTLLAEGTVVDAGDITGTLAQTLADVLLDADGSVLVRGVLAQTLASLTSDSDGLVLVRGQLAETLAQLTSTGAGDVDVRGTLSKTLEALLSDAEGRTLIRGALTQTLGALTVVSTGVVGELIVGTLAQTLAPLTLVASGTVTEAPAPSPEGRRRHWRHVEFLIEEEDEEELLLLAYAATRDNEYAL